MDVNVLITCFDTEKHIPYLLGILKQFKQINPSICVIYCGRDTKIPCTVRLSGTKKNSMELSMVIEGMRWFKSQKNSNTRFLKLSAYVWPLDESKIVSIFEDMDKERKPYAGNVWHHNLTGSLAADFFLLNTEYGNIFQNVTRVTNDSEVTIFQLLKEKRKSPYIIPERDPVFWNNYWECEKLGLLMRPDLEINLKLAKEKILNEGH
jgi:hypothetical protein